MGTNREQSDSDMNHDKHDHSKMGHDHSNAPMGMAGQDYHKMMIEDFNPEHIWSYSSRLLQVFEGAIESR